MTALAAVMGRGVGRSVVRWRRAAGPGRAYLVPGLVLSAAVVGLAVLGPALAPTSPYHQDLAAVLHAPGPAHRFGTDGLGRDVLSRVLYGVRLTLEAGTAIVVSSFVVGMVLGALAGFFGGVVDEVLMRAADLILSFPWLVLAMAVATALGPSVVHGIVSLVIVWWPVYARVTRGEVLRVKNLEYVEASHAAGARRARILRRTVLPNVLGVPMSMMPLDFGRALGAFAGLSFLGLAARPPAAELGAMLNEARTTPLQWWIDFYPGAALAFCILASNLLGLALRRRGALRTLR